MPQDESPKVFISHSSQDQIVIDALVELLRLAISGIREEDIRYTSNPVTGLSPGAWITAQLISEIRACKCFIVVISDSYLSSQFCLWELGVKLGSQDPEVIAVHLPGIEPTYLGGVFNGMNVVSLMDEESVRDVIRRIAQSLGWKSNPSQKKLTELCNQTRANHPTPIEKWRKKLVGIQDGRVFINTYGLAERPVRRKLFQDFHPRGANIQPVQYLWADPRHGNSIRAELIPAAGPQKWLLRIHFQYKPSSLGCNFAIRPLNREAIFTESGRITISARVPEASQTKEIGLRIRVVNGYMQHWESTSEVLRVCGDEFHEVSLDFEASDWAIFGSDGTSYAGPTARDFSIISSVVISVGGHMALGLEPIAGDGILDIRSVEIG